MAIRKPYLGWRLQEKKRRKGTSYVLIRRSRGQSTSVTSGFQQAHPCLDGWLALVFAMGEAKLVEQQAPVIGTGKALGEELGKLSQIVGLEFHGNPRNGGIGSLH